MADELHGGRAAGAYIRSFVMRNPRIAMAIALGVLLLLRLLPSSKVEPANPKVEVSVAETTPTPEPVSDPATLAIVTTANEPQLEPGCERLELTDDQAKGRGLILMAYAWATRKPTGAPPLMPNVQLGEVGLLMARGLYEMNQTKLESPNGKVSCRKFLCYKDANGDIHPDRKEFAEWFAESNIPKRLLDSKMTRIGGGIHVNGCWCWQSLVIGDDSDTKDSLLK